MTIRCGMCYKPLKSKRFIIRPMMRPDLEMTVGPDCFKKEKEAREQMKRRYTPEQLEAIRTKIASEVKS